MPLCEVVTIEPPLRLPWRYTPEQEETGDVWELETAWLHSAAADEDHAAVREDLRNALDDMDPESARHTLLVDPDGMFYDRNRFGGDHQVLEPRSGRRFTLSVRRGPRKGTKILLAIDWGVF
jgi:hypothetical protein